MLVLLTGYTISVEFLEELCWKLMYCGTVLSFCLMVPLWFFSCKDRLHLRERMWSAGTHGAEAPS